MLTGLALAYVAFTLVFAAVFVVVLVAILRSGRFSVNSRRDSQSPTRAARDADAFPAGGPDAPGRLGGDQSA